MRSQVGYATIKMESAIYDCKDAEIYEGKAKLPDWYHSRHISRVLGIVKNDKRSARDIIIHGVALCI